MILLKDIAHEVNVSVSLVSKVLNNKMGTTGISPDTVELVREAATRLGYRKNTSAVALQKGRHNVFGVYIHHMGTPGSEIMEDMIRGISSTAWKYRQRLSLAFFESTADAVELCESAHPNSMDGLIMAGLPHDEVVEQLRSIRNTGLPIVTLYDKPVSADIVNIGMAQIEVGRAATQHLIENGARQIAHIVNNDDRFEGYRKALREAGIRYDEQRVFRADAGQGYSHITGETAIRAFRDRGVKFDAVFAQSDQEAVGCIRELDRNGVSVPGDVIVIGVDNAPYCEFVRTPVSSVSQRFMERGEKAVDLLMSLINGKKASSVDFKPLVVPRASTRR